MPRRTKAVIEGELAEAVKELIDAKAEIKSLRNALDTEKARVREEQIVNSKLQHEINEYCEELRDNEIEQEIMRLGAIALVHKVQDDE